MATDAASIAAVSGIFDACARDGTHPIEAGIRRDALIAAYCGADRHYHDIKHIAAMLSLLDLHGGPDIDWLSIRWAILYHDVVYDPHRKDNEAMSAAAMERDFAAMGIDGDLARRVKDLILATRHGEVAAATDGTKALLIDLDLAVLGSAPERYSAYAAAIRREYAHVADGAYALGRARVLEGFLDRPAIYTTPALAAPWEKAARENLAREIDILRNGG